MTSLAVISLAAPGMVLGAVLVGLPIAAHLLSRKARRRVMFPSIELLSAAAASRSSVFRIRRLLLLLLRCLTVILLVLAFTQPVWQSAEAQRADRQGASVVILFDRSASTAQLRGGVSVMRSLKARALDVLDGLTPGRDHANIVFADARPNTALPSMTTNTDALRTVIREIEPTRERADLIGTLALSGQVLREHVGPMRLVIVSDMQASNWRDAIDRLGQDKLIPSGVRVVVIPPDGGSPGNLSLHHAGVRPALPRVGVDTNLSVRLTNHGDGVRPATVHLRVDGEETGTRSLTLDAHGEQEVAFTVRFDRPGEHRVVFSTGEDGLASDNACFLVVRVAERTPVLLITDDGVDRPGTAGYFLTRALAPYNDTRDRYEVLPAGTSANTWPDIGRAAAVIVGDAGVLGKDRLDVLTRYVEGGGCAVFFCEGDDAGTNLAALNAIMGTELSWLPVAPRYASDHDTPMKITDGEWRSSLLSLFDESARLAFSDIPIRRVWTGGPVGESTEVLLWYDDRTPALCRQSVEAGLVMIANFGVSERLSDFGKHGLFVALLQAMIHDAGLRVTPREQHTVGQFVSLSTAVPIRTNGRAPEVFAPDGGRELDITLATTTSNTVIGIDAPGTPGFYTAQQGETVLGSVAVNTDPLEGDLKQVAEDELIAAMDTPTADVSIRSAGIEPGLSLNGKDLWGWFVIGAFGSLGIELLFVGYWRR